MMGSCLPRWLQRGPVYDGLDLWLQVESPRRSSASSVLDPKSCLVHIVRDRIERGLTEMMWIFTYLNVPSVLVNFKVWAE